ncbi:hypothetical protein CP967_15365 [Streptomyces nitrosporeus]|uniref:Uncharacterized protein n=1 Tax=Streptomyces nitrosporeus TaxID=28894 RepID=A0A5J6FAB5_9ACTN|nr:hypothetical protein CP967_15365 [Streptomyces nitrosporeus]GGZ09772.1 hypothetical protein GCM10010327_45470 [Streptomyces nitrosporeus]
MRVTDSTPENDEPTSFGQKTKKWYEKNKPTIRAVGGAFGAVAAFFAVAVVAYTISPDDAEDAGSAADSADESEQRNSPVKHAVTPHTRRLSDGREIDVSGYERGGSSEDEDEDPGEAAA